MQTLDVKNPPTEIRKPRPGMTRAEKFANGGEYFAQMGRYIVRNFYNTYQAPSSIAGMPPTSVVAEQLDSFKYYYGYGDNRIFNYMTTTYSGGKVPAVWINGQNIRTFVDHIKGNVEEMIAPMSEGIHAESISENAVLNKRSIFERIEKAGEYNKLFEGTGVSFAPQGDMDYGNPTEVEKVKEEIRKKLELVGTTIARYIFFSNDLRSNFIDDVVQAAVGNLAGTYIYERNGRVVFDEIPCYNLIHDYGSGGEFGDNQWFTGFVIPMTIEEVIAKWPQMAPEMKGEMLAISSGSMPSPFESYDQFRDYHNAPFQNVRWWYNDLQYVSVAFLFWQDNHDMRFNDKVDAYGQRKTRSLKDHREYEVGGEVKRGFEVKGDKETNMNYRAILVGNKWLVEHGYETYQVRPFGNKDKPQLPIFTYCPAKYGGYVRSIVSRLKQNQNELDRLSYKIQELTAQDLGTVFFVRGDKIASGTSPKDIIDDLKSFKIHVLPMTGEETPDNTGIKDIIERVDLSNNQYLLSYLELKKEQLREMENIASIPAPALGMQDRVIGKGVQDRQISQSSLAMMSFYKGLENHWRRKIQYAANKQKLIFAKDEGQHILPISLSEQTIISTTKDIRFEDFFIYFEPNDSINAQDKSIMDQLLLAYSQGSQNELAAARAMLNGLNIMKGRTYGENIAKLKKHIEELKVEAEVKYKREVMVAQDQQQSATMAQQQLQLQQQLAKIYEIITKSNLDGAWGVQKAESTRADKDADEAVIGAAAQEQAQIKAQTQPQQGGPQGQGEQGPQQ